MFAVPREQVARIHASSGTTGKPTVVGYTQERHRHLGRPDGALDPRRRRPRRATWCTSPTATACSPAASARTTAPSALGCTVIPMSGGQTEKQVQLIHDFKPDIIMVTPSYMLAIVEEFERQGLDPRESLAEGRHLRRRAVDRTRCAREIEAGARHRRGRHLRPVGSDGPGRRQRVHRDQGRPASSGRTISIPRSSIPRPARCCPTARRASWSSPR